MNLSVILTEIFMFESLPSSALQVINSIISGCHTGIAHIMAARLTLPPLFVVSPTASNNFINVIDPEDLPSGILVGSPS
jgi:hypothetical protein